MTNEEDNLMYDPDYRDLMKRVRATVDYDMCVKREGLFQIKPFDNVTYCGYVNNNGCPYKMGVARLVNLSDGGLYKSYVCSFKKDLGKK